MTELVSLVGHSDNLEQLWRLPWTTDKFVKACIQYRAGSITLQQFVSSLHVRRIMPYLRVPINLRAFREAVTGPADWELVESPEDERLAEFNEEQKEQIARFMRELE